MHIFSIVSSVLCDCGDDCAVDGACDAIFLAGNRLWMIDAVALYRIFLELLVHPHVSGDNQLGSRVGSFITAVVLELKEEAKGRKEA